MASSSLTRKSMIKVINNTTGLLSFNGIDDKKYAFEREGSFKLIELGIIEGLYSEHESFISKGYIYFDDKKVYDFLGVPEEIFKKIIPLDAIPKFLEKDAEELQSELKELPDNIKENVAIVAKKQKIDSRKKVKAIQDETGFDISEDEE